jgi:hypothetical protein
MKKHLIATLAFGLASLGHAALLDVSTDFDFGSFAPNSRVAYSDGSASSLFVVVGYYTSTPDFGSTTASQAWNDFNALYTFSDDNGEFNFFDNSKQVAGWTGTNNPSPAVNKTVYAWVFSSDYDGVASAGTAASTAKGTFGSATEYGLFFQPSSLWGESPNIDTNFGFTDSVVNGTEVAGGWGSKVTGGTGTDTTQFRMVPEPSTAALGLLAALGLVARRRRD